MTVQSFDDFELKLGDVMRGERATLGKSLLDVQRDLRIKASYIAAIENCDPSAFETPGFIAGYVRSYARYLGLDPDETFAIFCEESGFSTAHGMSQKASSIRKPDTGSAQPAPKRNKARDPLLEPRLPFSPGGESLWSRVEPGAIGSTLVLLALIGGIGYGGWTVLQEIQRVQVAPVDQTPTVLSELDPVDAATRDADLAEAARPAGVMNPPTIANFDRLYRPEALDVPVVVARDAPISSLDPSSVGLFAETQATQLPLFQDSSLAAMARPVSDKLFDAEVAVVAARPAWVEVKDGAGRVLYSRVMDGGDVFEVPGDVADPVITIGESGAVFFALGKDVVGPAGANGAVTQGLPLEAEALKLALAPAQTGADRDLDAVLAEFKPQAPAIANDVNRAIAQAVAPDGLPQIGSVSVPVAQAGPDTPRPQGRSVAQSPRVLAEGAPGVVVVATAETWVEVTAASGKKLFAQVMQPGETYMVPQTQEPPVIFSGNAGGVYFAVNGQTFGPYGASGQFGRNLALDGSAIAQRLALADLTQNQQLARTVAELQGAAALPGQ